MPSFKCEKCGEWFKYNPFKEGDAAAVLKKAQEHCGLHKGPCLTCTAKNFCGNKNPTDPTISGNAARIKQASDVWRVRGCR